MEENTRDLVIRRMRKDVVGCVQDVVGKNNFLVPFEHRQKKDMISSSLPYERSKEEVCLKIDELISDLTQKQQGGLLTIDGYPGVE